MAGKLVTSCVLLLLASVGETTPLKNSPIVPASHAVHERRGHSQKWVKGSRVHPRSVLPMRIGLAQSGIDAAHDHLMDISNPRSPNYGKYWTQEEVWSNPS
jgi:hypothetical protein